MAEKKPDLAILLSEKPAKKVGEKPEAESAEGDDEELEAIAQDVLDAISSKDAKALASALRACCELCTPEE